MDCDNNRGTPGVKVKYLDFTPSPYSIVLLYPMGQASPDELSSAESNHSLQTTRGAGGG